MRVGVFPDLPGLSRAHNLLAMQVYDTAEWFTGRLYCNNVMILRMYAIDSIAIHSIEDDDEAVSI
jgi:hypothetical protein